MANEHMTYFGGGNFVFPKSGLRSFAAVNKEVVIVQMKYLGSLMPVVGRGGRVRTQDC